MAGRVPRPGVSRSGRLSDEGLQRLERQLKSGGVSDPVLQQWIRRYGDAARDLVRKYHRGEPPCKTD